MDNRYKARDFNPGDLLIAVEDFKFLKNEEAGIDIEIKTLDSRLQQKLKEKEQLSAKINSCIDRIKAICKDIAKP